MAGNESAERGLVTAHDVRNQLFTAVRFREGWDQVEVDEFLDRVAETLEMYETETARLRAEVERLASARPEA